MFSTTKETMCKFDLPIKNTRAFFIYFSLVLNSNPLIKKANKHIENITKLWSTIEELWDKL